MIHYISQKSTKLSLTNFLIIHILELSVYSIFGGAPVSTAKSNLVLQVRLLLTSNQLKQITEDDSFVEDEQFALAA